MLRADQLADRGLGALGLADPEHLADLPDEGAPRLPMDRKVTQDTAYEISFMQSELHFCCHDM